MFVIPKPGVRVVDPVTRKPLPAVGRDVPENAYWVRRLDDGDVVLRDEPAKSAEVTE